MSDGMSKRAVMKEYGFNAKHLSRLLERGFLKYLPGGSPLRKKVNPETIEKLEEGYHYVVCLECGAYQAQITSRHLKSCSDVSLQEYKEKYDSEILCQLTKENRKKTEAQKKHQSEVLKKRFKTPEGEKTREQISRAAKELMQTEYRGQAANHLRALNNNPERKARISKQTKERWDNGDLRDKVEGWHENNPEKSRRLAKRARSFVNNEDPSNLHLNFKELLLDSGFDNFITHYDCNYYEIDEADPNLKIAIEVDGCYWHSCLKCGFDGPKGTKNTDARKESYLENRGWEILRFWGHDIKNNSDSCLHQVSKAVKNASKR